MQAIRNTWRRGASNGWAWLALLLGLVATGYGYQLARDTVAEQLRTRFEYEVRNVQEEVLGRMVAYRQVLRGAAAFVDATGPVSREEWQTYVRRLHVDENYAGIQGIGYAEYVTAEELPEHEARVRGQGFPEYRVWPEGERPFYGAIIFLEPFDWRNRRAFGYDMLSEPTRRQAMLRSALIGDGVLSGKVTLVQETEDDVQAGALLYLPVYRGGNRPTNPEARREALRGWVYSPFRMADLMSGILGDAVDNLQLSIYDGTGTEAEDLMLRMPERAVDGRLEASLPVSFAEHSWTLVISTLPGFATGSERDPLVVLVLGSALSLLLFAIVRNLATTRSRAQALAQTMTAALRQSEERFRVALKNTNITVFNQDRDLRLTWVFNPRHGWAQQAVPGRTDYEVPAQQAAIPLKRRVLDEGVSVHQQIETELDGRTLVYDLTLEPLREDGRIVGLTGAAVDVTEHRQIEDELRRAEAALRSAYGELEQRVEQRTLELRRRSEELARSNAELAQFAYVASHDLQEPLRTVASFSQLLALRYDAALDAEGREFLRHIAEGTERMRALIRDLLTFSQVGAGEAGARPVELEAVLAQVLEGLRAAIEEADAVITHDPLPQVMGYEHDLIQLFQNLLVNAIKFRGAAAPRIHLGVEEQEEAWCFSVTDNGIGIEDQDLEQIFTIFRRIHPRERYPGTGIGLAICRKIVQRHGGELWASSRPGEGSTFSFTLPK